MAAPPQKTIKDLNGLWVMNKTLSNDPDPALALQGISWLLRKAIGFATVTLDISQYEGPANPPYDSEPGSYVHIDVQQIATAGLKGNKECRCLDWRFREVSDWMFGRVRGRSKFIRVRGSKENGEGEEEDLAGARGEDAEFLRSNWLVEDDEGPQQLISYVESLDAGWTATQVWGFQMVEPAPGEEPERRHCRNIVVAKGDDRVRFRLVYDYVPPAAEGGKEDDVDDDLAY